MKKSQPKLNEEQMRKLNELGQKKPVDSATNNAVFLAWRNEVWIFLFDNYTAITSSSEQMSDAADARVWAINRFCENIRAFDPAKSNLSNYALHSIARDEAAYYAARQKDDQRGGMRGTPRQEKETELDSMKKEVGPIVIHIENDGENEDGSIMQLPDRTNIIEHLTNEAYVQQMTAMILNFKQSCPGNKGRLSKQDYYKMWFSEKTTLLIQLGIQAINQTDVLKALDFEYLSYFTQEDFTKNDRQTWRHLVNAGLKETVPVKFQPDPIKVRWKSNGWLEAGVPRGYIEFAIGEAPANSVISEQRKSYLLDLTGLFTACGL